MTIFEDTLFLAPSICKHLHSAQSIKFDCDSLSQCVKDFLEQTETSRISNQNFAWALCSLAFRKVGFEKGLTIQARCYRHYVQQYCIGSV